MSKEQDIINRILSILPESEFHGNRFFESDADLFTLNGKKLLISIDGFSEEDFFRDDDPLVLGWNLAVGTISDILACGGRPLLYAHSISIPIKTWNSNYIASFSKGIAKALNECGAGFISGDTGCSDRWQYTGVVIGESDNPLTRMGIKPGQQIYMTGSIGLGNLEAALKLYSKHKILRPLLNKFHLKLALRLKESELISKYACACIDSSDGTLNALNTLADLNHVGYKLTELTYAKEARLACKLLAKPETLLLVGECGEYELIFTLNRESEEEFLKEAGKKGLTYTKIGEITENGQKLLVTKKDNIDFSNYAIRARDFDNLDAYLNAIMTYVREN